MHGDCTTRLLVAGYPGMITPGPVVCHLNRPLSDVRLIANCDIKCYLSHSGYHFSFPLIHRPTAHNSYLGIGQEAI